MIKNDSDVNLNLENIVELDEVIVNAYGTSYKCMIIRCGGYSVNIVENFAKAVDLQPKLFPNPSPNGRFQIKFAETYSKVRVSVASINGQIVETMVLNKVDGSIDLDLSNLTSGMYVINLIADGKRLQPKKLILN